MNRIRSIVAACAVLPILGLLFLPVHSHGSEHGPNGSRDCPVCLTLRSASHVDLPGEVHLSLPTTFEWRPLVEQPDSLVSVVSASWEQRAPPA